MSRAAVHLRLAGMVALWGASWPAGRVMALSMPAFSASAWRFTIAATLLLAWLRWHAGAWPHYSRRQWAGLVAAGLAGCAGDIRGVLLPVATAAPDASRVTMLVATTRAPDPDEGLLFSGERGRPSFAEITVSVPSETRRKVGEVQWPKALPGNPETDFVTLKVEKLARGGGSGRRGMAAPVLPLLRLGPLLPEGADVPPFLFRLHCKGRDKWSLGSR